MILFIGGSRNFVDYELLERSTNHFIEHHPNLDLEIVSGGARGADELGEMYADAHDIPKDIKYADWDNFGKRAGYIRNKEMVDKITHALIFWDGASIGTSNMIKLCRERGICGVVIQYIQGEIYEL